MAAGAKVTVTLSVADMALVLNALESHAQRLHRDYRDTTLPPHTRRMILNDAERSRQLAEELRS